MPPSTGAIMPPSPQQATANPNLCRRLSNTHRQVWFSLLWGHCSISPESWYAQDFVCALQKSLFPPVLWKIFRVIPWGFPVPLLDPQVGKSDVMPRTFILMQEHLVLLFSHLWVAHLAGMGFDFNMIAPLLLPCGFSFVLGWSIIFLAMAVILVFSQESMRHVFLPCHLGNYVAVIRVNNLVMI